jgi:hypothetical protein
MELQLEATAALRKIADLLKMAGPTGTLSKGLGATDYPVFALDQAGGGFTGANTFINLATWQTVPGGGASTTLTDDGVGHLAPVTAVHGSDEGYYGTSNEIAFKLPRPAPWYLPQAGPTAGAQGPAPGGSIPSGVNSDNPIDITGAPVDATGAVTWGVTPNLYAYYMGYYTSPVYPPVTGAGSAIADRQTDVYAIVLVPTTTLQKDAYGNAVPGPNQLELREFSAPNPPAATTGRYLIRRTILAVGVERILFTGPAGSSYYLTGSDPLFATPPAFTDATLGQNQLGVTIWMWRNDMNKTSKAISAYRTKQSITVNLRSVGENQQKN